MEDILVPLGFFTLIGLSVYFINKFKYQTRKAIIEKGGNITFPERKKPILEIAFTLVGLGIGLALSSLLEATSLVEDAQDKLTGAFIFIFSGLGLVTAIFIRRKLEKNEKK